MNALTSRPAHRARRSMMLATLALPLAIFAVPAVAVAAPVSSALTLTASPAVVDWGRNAVIAVHLAVPPGSSVSVGNRVVHIQFSPTSGPAGFTTIPSVGDVTTNASGNATLAYSPAVNLWYRAVFDGTDDLAPATSNSARVLVRERVTISPNNAGKVKTVRKSTRVDFSTRVQPTFDNLARPHVVWEIWGTRKQHVPAARDVRLGSQFGRCRITRRALQPGRPLWGAFPGIGDIGERDECLDGVPDLQW